MYDEVKIGNQIWMSRNLDIGTFRNGEPVPLYCLHAGGIDEYPEARNDAEWRDALRGCLPASCYYKSPNAVYERSHNTTPSRYGRLYNWYAVNDPRGLAPEGWHISTDEEWIELIKFLGDKTAGVKLKAANSGWSRGTNESGFSALPSGVRISGFAGEFEHCHYWTSSLVKANPQQAIFRGLDNATDFVIPGKMWKDAALSVRCVKD